MDVEDVVIHCLLCRAKVATKPVMLLVRWQFSILTLSSISACCPNDVDLMPTLFQACQMLWFDLLNNCDALRSAFSVGVKHCSNTFYGRDLPAFRPSDSTARANYMRMCNFMFDWMFYYVFWFEYMYCKDSPGAGAGESKAQSSLSVVRRKACSDPESMRLRSEEKQGSSWEHLSHCIQCSTLTVTY